MTRNAQLWRTGAQPLQEGSLASPFSGGDPTRPLTPLQIPFHLWSHLSNFIDMCSGYTAILMRVNPDRVTEMILLRDSINIPVLNTNCSASPRSRP